MHWGNFIVLTLGGLSIFLFGMTVMIDALKSAAGNHMKTFLQKMTKNRFTALIAGTSITAVIQSSSVTTVLAVGFVSAGLLSFQSTLGVILGANVGTTITAQIIAFKITKASYFLVAFGYLVSVFFPRRKIKDIGLIILGLGLVFLGMNLMSEATEPLKNYAPFISLIEGLDNHLIGILIGIIFTAAVQSSSATTGVVIVMASQNLIGTDAGIAIIMGANVGTCVTAVLSALGKPRDAMRVALSHVLFNLLGVIIWYAFIQNLGQLVELISPNDNARQIANAHTIFNLGNTLLFIWLVKPVSRLILFILPVSKKAEKELFPELHSFYLENSAMAIELAKKSIFKLGEHLLMILKRADEIALKGSEKDLYRLRNRDAIIDKGQTEILQFLRQIEGLKLSKKEVNHIENLIEAVNILESTADIITTDLVEASEHRIEKDFISSEETIQKLTELYEMAEISLKEALNNFLTNRKFKELTISKDAFKHQMIQVRSHLMKRLTAADEQRIAIFRFESEMLEVTRRLHGLARRLNRKAV